MPPAASGAALSLTAPGRGPNLRLGLRTILAAVLPLLGASLLHQPALIWMSLGGLYVSMADTGGAYRTRATAMGCASLLGALALGAGIGLASWPWLCVPAMFAVGLGCGLLSLYGNAGALIGLVTAWCFLIGINVAGPDPAKALDWSLLYLAGGAWATLLAVAVWPLQPYGPVRDAIAEALEATAHWFRLACPADGGLRPPEERLFAEKLRVRRALAEAQETLAATRSGRLGESPADAAFLQLIETTDGLFVTGAALGDRLAAIPAGAAATVECRLQQLNGRCLAALLQLERALRGRGGQPALGQLAVESQGIAQTLEDQPPSAAAAALRHAQACQAHWIATLAQACAALPLVVRTRGAPPPHRPTRQLRAAIAQGWVTLRANLTLESSVFRHGLRFGIASAVAVTVYTLFSLPIGYWITLTVSVILRPSAGESLSRINQRLLGTVLGGILAIVLATLFPHPLTIVLLLVPLTLVMMALLPVNYGLFVFFLTPWIVLYKDIVQPGDWGLALWRIANTLIGAALALAALHLVLPRWEGETLPSRLAASLRANAGFAAAVFAACQEGAPSSPGPMSAPGTVRLAIANAQSSIQCYLSERSAHQPMALPLMAFLLHSQRLIDALVLQSSCRGRTGGSAAPIDVRPLRDWILFSLAALATALERHERPQPLPDPPGELATRELPLAFLPVPLQPFLDAIEGLRSAVAAWSERNPAAVAPD